MAGKKNLLIHRNRGFQTQGLGLRNHMNLAQGVGIDFQDGLRFQDELVAGRGEILVLETTIACPKCRSGDSEDPLLGNMNCESCSGDGYLFRNPRYVQALITGINLTRDLAEAGWVIPGDCLMSPAPSLRPQVADFDKVTFTWPQPVGDGQIIVRGAAYRRQRERGSSRTLTADEDVLHYQGANAIHVEDEDENEYYQDADFVFDKKVIRWLNSGNQPTIRSRYVVKYEAYLEWIAFNPPQERRDQGRNLGPRVVLRKRHVALNRNDPKADTGADKADKALFGGKVTI